MSLEIVQRHLKATRSKWIYSKQLNPTQKSLIKEAELKAQVMILQKVEAEIIKSTKKGT